MENADVARNLNPVTHQNLGNFWVSKMPANDKTQRWAEAMVKAKSDV